MTEFERLLLEKFDSLINALTEIKCTTDTIKDDIRDIESEIKIIKNW